MAFSEPWVALAETSTGHLIVPCGRDAGAALAAVAHWRAQVAAGVPMDPYRVCAGAAVVDPAGAVVESWGSVPTPGGRARWLPLLRLREVAPCRGCGELRWPGCWVAFDLDGCSGCVPAAEVHDPRVWPSEPARPAALGRRAVSATSAPAVTYQRHTG